MHATKNSLPLASREATVKLLAPRLADAIDLASHAKQAHWAARGPQFIALHQLFDQVADAADGFQDLLAERIAQLGGQPEGTLAIASSRTSLPAYPTTLVDALAHASQLATSLSIFAAGTRQAIDAAASATLGDAVTADMLTQITRDADKLTWFLEAHTRATS
jgi:starvation-inducible DNA-binding protein